MVSTMSWAIYYNYLQTIEKLINEYRSKGMDPALGYREICDKAYKNTKGALEKCFDVESIGSVEEFLNFFTRTGNSRDKIKAFINNDPKVARRMLISEFLQRNPRNEKEKILRDSMFVTQSNYSLDFLCDSVRKVLTEGDFNGFSRFLKGSLQLKNHRENIEHNIKPNEILDIFMQSIINEYEKSNPFQKPSHDRAFELMQEQIIILAEKHPGVHNTRVNNNMPDTAISKATDKVWSSTRYIEGSVGNDLYFVSDIGKGRNNQEDSVVLMYHPANPNFKMLVVADGLGGCENGERASSNIVLLISEWFKTLPVEFLKSGKEQELQKKFEEQIKKINATLFAINKGVKEDIRSGSTFCGALVGEKSTIISNVGDSRAYTYSKGKLKQVTRDDTFVFYGYEQGIIDKEDIRFQPGSNELLKAVGKKEEVYPRSTIIKNSEYECLMLFSDGITDCLMDEQIKAITRETNRRKLAEALVRASNDRGFPKNDNRTTAVLDKRGEKSR